jgi:hypothetical protein
LNPSNIAAQTGGRIALPDVPVIAVTARQAAWLSTDGEVEMLSHERAQMMAHKTPVMLCHAPYTCKRLGADDILGFDVLELFAFVHPATFCVPTPTGLARALGLSAPQSLEDMPITIMEAAQALLGELQRELGLALVFVAHDLAVVRQVSDRVAVMRRGRIVESGPADEVYDNPQEPYTKQLLAAVPALDPQVAARRRAARRELAAA